MKTILTGLLLFAALKGIAQTDTSYTYEKPLFDFDYKKPVFDFEKTTNVGLSLRYAALTGYREGVQSNTNQMVNYDKRLQVNHFYWNNLSIKQLLMTNFLILPGRFLFEVKDASKYAYSGTGEEKLWLRKNGYCFEYMLPAGAIYSAEEKQRLIEDLLGLEGKWEQRKVKCLALVRTSAVSKLKPGGKSIPGIIKTMEYMIGMDGTNYGSPLPIVDQTNGLADGLEGSFVWSDLATIRKQLQAYDLDLVEKVLETKVYVVREIKD